MFTKELIGRKITNIFTLVNYESYGLDTAENFVELDHKTIIGIPFSDQEEVWIKNLNPDAISIFKDLTDEMLYYVNKKEKTIGELANKYRKEKKSLLGRLKTLIGINIVINDYKPYKVESREYKAKYIQNRTIVDIIWYADEIEKSFIELDNGYVITETITAMNGTGLAGLNYFETLDSLTKTKGLNFMRLTDKIKDGS
jgi:hypothetical protein